MAETFDKEFGPNDWLVEEMLERYRSDPTLVPQDWREYFEQLEFHARFNDLEVTDTRAREVTADTPLESAKEQRQAQAPGPTQSAPGPTQSASEPAPQVAPEPAPQVAGSQPAATPLRGAAGALAKNMTASLSVPTATSVRTVPTKALEINRGLINNQLDREGRSKVSFGHLIAWAIVSALVERPAMNSVFVDDADGKGTPGVLRSEEINVGIAVDLVRPDGQRTLMVPVIKKASSLGPAGFFEAYDQLIKKVRQGKVSADDFVGATVSITNPGTIGTQHSIPRLMSGQAAIVGVGAIAYPPEFEAADPATLSEIGVSKVVTLTSTYDHRIIQGAESGQFLADVAGLIEGAGSFYTKIFDSLEIAYPPVGWSKDRGSSQSSIPERAEKQIHVQTLINNYRVRGHLLAHLDPLKLTKPSMSPELDPATFGLTLWDLTRSFLTDGLAGTDQLELQDIVSILRDTYCRSIGFEYMHIQNPEEKRWLQRRIEGVDFRLSKEERLEILGTLNDAEAFEKFLSTRYIGQKRFGLEGAESAIVFLRETLNQAIRTDISAAAIGMAHRGRLNVLANIVGKSYRNIFEEFEGNLDPNSVQGSGDVKYHKGFDGFYRGPTGQELPVTLASNPSHLEAVDPVVEGMVRAMQDLRGNLFEFGVLAILVHGDASFAGQGVVAETLNLSQLPGYRTGGTVHLVINNQVGFTTNPQEARSSVYASDIATAIQAPIFHVNGDDPEAVARTARLALDYRNAFHKDVVVDMVCYRRHGHNEGDEPSYTQPLMYKVIENQPSTRKIYQQALVRSEAITAEESEAALDAYLDRLQQALGETREAAPPKATLLPPAPMQNVPLAPVLTQVKRDVLEHIHRALNQLPDGFTLHPKLVRQFKARRELFESGEVDWALGEAFAFGTILLDGRDIRMAGQDTRRGTFSHRHAALYDYETGEMFQPLARLDPESSEVGAIKPGRFMIYDSLLSEYAAMGFEYGYSLKSPEALTIWEAQFGDFSNGAQIVIDQFIAGAHDKWGQTSGLTLLLPHGYEGQGPEHSSARLERFLSLAAGANMAVANPTSAAQLFHLLRAQAARRPARPLIVATPKSLLRARQSRSRIEDLTTGSFQPVLDDAELTADVERNKVRRLILASGKVGIEAAAERSKGCAVSCAIARVEQLYPWPSMEIAELLQLYPGVEEVVWLQEEPENMGAWPVAHANLHSWLGNRLKLRHVARVAAGSPATGSAAMHALEQADLFERALRQPLA